MQKRTLAVPLVLALGSAVWAQDKDAGVAATVNGKPITLAELDEEALGTNMKLAQSVYDARKAALDLLIAQRLLADQAKEQGTSAEALLEKKIAEKAKPVTGPEIEDFYNQNKARVGNQTLEQLSGQIRDHLTQQREAEAKKAVLDELMKDQQVKIALDPPRAKIKVAKNDPAKGPKDAPITVVEFSEFQ